MTTARRIDALTGLRFVAALGVFLSHLPGIPGAPAHLQTFVHAGYNGVTLFFILSGFVLAWNYDQRLGDRLTGRGLWSFAVARVARVYPLYLVALAVATGPLVAAGEPTPFLWYHVLALQSWSGDLANANGYNGPGWSIGVEFFLYACFPLLLFALRPIRRNARALGVVVAACLLLIGGLLAWAHLTGRAHLLSTDPRSAHRWLYRTPLTRLGDFGLGMAGAFLVMHARARWGRACQVAGGLTTLATMTSATAFYTAASFDALYALPMFLLIVGLAAAPKTLLGRLLATRTAVYLGEASFAFYLLHFTFLTYFTLHWPDTFAHWLVAQVMFFTVALFAAAGAHQLVEKPAQRWIRRLLDRPARSGRVVEHNLAEDVAGVQPLERGADVAERVHRVDHRPSPGLRHEREQAGQLLRRTHARAEDLQL
jgi:peptidoglycan/LPS O-acetylase OafA/YrhL